MDLVRETAAGGHCWWFSRGVLDVFPRELAAIYDVKRNGQAPHPRFGAGWRPAPVVLRKSGSEWVGRVEEAGDYRVIGRFDGRWRTVREVKVDAAGAQRLKLEGASGVELLRKRR
ncbi:hypothetical protein CCB80_08955 [Armatimonadetes bacterium Uphvl-Ar1]|nr:hypothetical protein CCB80_08955 [Armatimonadetes bacterium Uphvl-Ar1]